MTDLLEKLLSKRPGAFVDVGANLGQTMLKVCSIDKKRSYVGFEPNPVCVGYLRQLIARNGLQNCTIIPVGIAPRAYVAGLNLYDGAADSSASIIPAFRRRTAETVPVPVMSDAELDLPETIAVLKIDVEGGELGVIEGLQSTIASRLPEIVVEILPTRNQPERRDRQERLETLLFGMGYQISIVRKQNGRLAGLEPVASVGFERTMDTVDFLFSRPSS
ncbi:FkbM family methyltransferase [Sphingosinicella terrae]|uniref:FkbM family methyltransferase n=1 Tax=Sphingosinicella terrae TaxID=2172047 RepID=UPI0013B430E7|nr:FkbM family methyltransferase [Sphingosinicella terrae]